ncbi:MAG: aminomethyl-transferring glycine dehydrogenase subunit GcvPB [Candidatus Latescibacteria bacterium]|nr:aminomethyl-transferring glycine dehydrogenase subunit GcvPB [Candidatus Latescibacterota bacterium]
MPEPLIFELSSPGRRGYSMPNPDVPVKPIESLLPAEALRNAPPELPEVSEVDVVRHFTRLSSLNYHPDRAMYPLGSCTMKHNPRLNEDVAALPGFARVHPLQPDSTCQGAIRLLYELSAYLAEIAGMDAVTLQPAAGAHGELTGLMMMRAYHERQGRPRRKVIIPDSAHGTNPASVTLVGYEAVQIQTNERGLVDTKRLAAVMDDEVAAFMLTNPNTLGLFESDIREIARIVHDAGALLYMDGANFNAILGITRPGDMGFDVVHFNLHKTFSTPHGGGGPGAGPVGVRGALVDFLPIPVACKDGDRYAFDYDRPHSIGRVRSFYCSFGMMVRAYAYIRTHGPDGLRQVSENAILNANYLLRRLEHHYPRTLTVHDVQSGHPREVPLPAEIPCQHEFVASGTRFKDNGVRTLDIAKRLLDFGFYAPTIYFPLIVPEAIMIEPTETESKESLDSFIDAMLTIAREIETEPEKVKDAPHTTPVSRLDETTAARNPDVRYRKAF